MMIGHYLEEAVPGQNKLMWAQKHLSGARGGLYQILSGPHSYPLGKEYLFECYIPHQIYKKHYSMVKCTNN